MAIAVRAVTAAATVAVSAASGPRPERSGGDEGPAPEFAPAFLTRDDD